MTFPEESQRKGEDVTKGHVGGRTEKIWGLIGYGEEEGKGKEQDKSQTIPGELCCLPSHPQGCDSLAGLRCIPAVQTSHSWLQSKASGFDIKGRTLLSAPRAGQSTLGRSLEEHWPEPQSLRLARNRHEAVGHWTGSSTSCSLRGLL